MAVLARGRGSGPLPRTDLINVDDIGAKIRHPEGGRPLAYMVWRGAALLGRLLDWSIYPEDAACPPDDRLFGFERWNGSDFDQGEAHWSKKLDALAALVGEPVELENTIGFAVHAKRRPDNDNVKGK